jgi:hypothetical protein
MSPEVLLKLHLEAAIARRVGVRGLHPQSVDDLVHRAISSGRFTVGHETGEMIDGGSDFAVNAFLTELEDDKRNAFLFQKATHARQKSPASPTAAVTRSTHGSTRN